MNCREPYGMLLAICLLHGACAPLAEGVADEAFDHIRESDQEDEHRAARSQRDLPPRIEWRCEPSSPKHVACKVSSPDAWRMCARVELACPDGTHLGRFCTRLPQQGAQDVTVGMFEPTVDDANQCTRIKMEWVSPAIAWQTPTRAPTHGEVGATTLPSGVERKRELARASYEHERRRFESCRPELEAFRKTSDRAEQGRVFAKMPEECQTLHWKLRSCEDMVADVASEENATSKSEKYARAISTCDALLPGTEPAPLTRIEVAEGMKAIAGNIRMCARVHELVGKVTAKIHIRDSVGEIVSVERGNAAFAQCANKALQSLPFRMAPPLTVQYPLGAP